MFLVNAESSLSPNKKASAHIKPINAINNQVVAMLKKRTYLISVLEYTAKQIAASTIK